jgi:Lipoprotein LpqB beta-propeller domain/Sporulation and spore germination
VSRRAVAVVALLLAVLTDLAASGCVSLPRSGPVQSRSVAKNAGGDALVDYTPAGPKPGSAPLVLVDNFLTAMTATPLNTHVAREFLTADSGRSWVPERGTVVYGTQQLIPHPGGRITVRLRDVVELDGRGTWRGDPTSGRGHDYRLRLVKEKGQWRISNPPDRLVIPRVHFDTQYQQYLLYFADRSAQVLVPEPVYVPSGRQAPTLLMAGLLKGPEESPAGVERTFLPPGTTLDGVSVPVSRGGTAEVPLSDRILDADKQELNLAFAQIAWTLGQVTGVQRLRVSVAGTPIDLPGSRGDADVGDFSEFDPSVAWASGSLFGVRDRRVMSSDTQGEDRVSGPFGTLPLAPRAIAVDPLAQHIAGVSADGRQVVVADRDGVPGRAARLSDTSTVYREGTDVLRPSYDLYGQLWVVDRTRSGARLSVVRGGAARSLTAPGITGARVSRFVLSRDGTRLVAQVRRGERDELVLARVLRDTKGRVLGVSPARRIVMQGVPDEIRDIAWRTSARIAVLVAPSSGTSEVLLAKVDGSSTATELSTDAALFQGRAVRLVTSSSTGSPLLLGTADGRLYELSGRGRFTPADIKRGLLAPTFVG